MRFSRNTSQRAESQTNRAASRLRRRLSASVAGVPSPLDRPFFFPAETLDEAISRIYALTGRTPEDSRGEKRALVALRDALGLDVDIARTNATLAEALARALHVEWRSVDYTVRNKVSLAGMNALLEGATDASHEGSLQKIGDASPSSLTEPEWIDFQPARSKIEAVTRIAALTGAPTEWLGPGGKEHKSVLINLADRLLPDADLNRSTKTKLGASIAEALGVTWTDVCESTGETISLIGLNTVLAGAERRLGMLGTEITDLVRTPEAEGDAIAAALLAKLQQHWDGRKCIKWLAARGLRGSNDNEWQGFYGEERAKETLQAAFTPRGTPPATRYGNTDFDYALNFVWDIKVHTEIQVVDGVTKAGRNETLLNDERAIRACVAEQGLGFLMLSGAAHMDHTGDFVAWHREFKAGGQRTASAASNSGNSRTRKAAFDLMHVESFWVPNSQALDAAILGGALRVRPIGRQAPKAAGLSGAARADKFEMRMRQARSSIRVARYDWSS